MSISSGEVRQTQEVRHLFPVLLANGYVPIPNRDKACYLPKWSTIYVDEEQARRWARQMKWPAIGLRVEPPLLVLDFDIPDPDIIKAIEDITPTLVFDGLERQGNTPKTAFFLRMDEKDEPFHKLATFRYLMDKTPFRIEAFSGGGGGKQIGSFGPHSHDEHGNVLKTYTWVDGRSPANVRLDELPVMTRAEVNEFLKQVDTLLIGWPGLVKDQLSRSGEKRFSHHEYSLNNESVFHDGEGFEWTLEELTADAKARSELKQPNMFVTGSFCDPEASTRPRAKVYWGKKNGLSIHDFKTDITHHVLNVPDDPELDKMLREVLPAHYFEEDA